jgi:actin-like ATPase involved in cell morphogenesis
VEGWVLAVDFGTTSTAAALRVEGRVELVEVDGSPRMPSMVFWREGTGGRTGRLVIGEQAQSLGVRAPWCLERTPKRRIGDEFLLLGEQEIRVVDAIAAILRREAEEAIARRGGQTPSEVRLTHPARWGQASLGALREAARIAGFDDPVFMPEPVAAAVHFASNQLAPGEHVAVYDLGGGTFDTAVLRRTEESFEVIGAPGGDEYLGGEDFDERLYLYLGSQLPADQWQQLRESTDRTWTHANFQLLIEARKAKEILSSSPDHDLYLPTPIDQDLHFTAEQFQALILQDLEHTVAELKRTIAGAGLQTADLSAVYLAGGSSRIPLISTLIEQQLGISPETLDDPKSAIALGAAAHTARVRSQPATTTRPAQAATTEIGPITETGPTREPAPEPLVAASEAQPPSGPPPPRPALPPHEPPGPQSPPGERRRGAPRWLPVGIAAAAVVALAVGLPIALSNSSSHTTTTTTTSTADSTTPPTPPTAPTPTTATAGATATTPPSGSGGLAPAARLTTADTTAAIDLGQTATFALSDKGAHGPLLNVRAVRVNAHPVDHSGFLQDTPAGTTLLGVVFQLESSVNFDDTLNAVDFGGTDSMGGNENPNTIVGTSDCTFSGSATAGGPPIQAGQLFTFCLLYGAEPGSHLAEVSASPTSTPQNLGIATATWKLP